MKRCPQCEAEYDDHVEYCFVDGAELVHVARGGASPLPPPPPPPRRSVLPLVIVFVFLAIVAVAALTAVVAVVTSDPPIASPAPVQPIDIEVPSTPPAQEVPVLIDVSSEPTGAEVWENQSKKCVTPCQIEHPEHAPTTRTFQFKKNGYRDAWVTMDESDVGTPLFSKLKKVRVAKPNPPPRPVPQNSAPDIMDER